MSGKLIKVDFQNPRARSTGTIIAPSMLGEWIAVSTWHPDSEWKGTVAEIRQARAIRIIVADDITASYAETFQQWKAARYKPANSAELFVEIQCRTVKLMRILKAPWWIENALDDHGDGKHPCADTALRNFGQRWRDDP